jgi:uncharacterized coiled-coil protein SlyX
MTEQSLEDRVAYLEQNIRALNEATTDTAKSIKALLTAHVAKATELSAVLDAAMSGVCPFPPDCSSRWDE